jgi:bifunctional non-homologous end joining protein LigD
VTATARGAAAEREVVLTNEDKVLYPATGFTKGDLVRWYEAVAEAILPHLVGHPVTLARYPDGVDAPGWYQTNCPPGRPPWLAIAEVRGGAGQTLRYCRIEDRAALRWVANTGGLELHPLLLSLDRPRAADLLVLDLDPVAPAGLPECARVALRLREELARAGLAAVPKTSGGRGLHLHAPLDEADFATSRRLARDLAERLAAEDPLVSARVSPRSARAGKVLVDWRQNEANRSLIAPWSLRAASVPTVATPLAWSEVEAAAASPDAPPLRFGPREALERLHRLGDPFAAAGWGRLPGPPGSGGRGAIGRST